MGNIKKRSEVYVGYLETASDEAFMYNSEGDARSPIYTDREDILEALSNFSGRYVCISIVEVDEPSCT